MSLNTFHPQGNTYLLALTTAPSAAAQVSTGRQQGARLANLSTNDAWIATGQTTATVALPTTAASGLGMPILQRSVETFVIPPGGYLSAMTSAGSAILAITPGYGQ